MSEDTLPKHILDDCHARKYTYLRTNNMIEEMWEREDDPRDYKETDADGKIVNYYFGDWKRVPQDEIDRLNAELKENNRVRKVVDCASRTAREADLEEALALLARLKATADGGDN